MSGRVKYKRKLYVIDKEFQFRYLLTWLLLVLSLVGGMVMATLALFFFFRESLFVYAIQINAALAVMLTGLSLYYMVRHSHHIAGPAYRLECVIHQLAHGEYDLSRKVYLRKRDYLKHIAEALNELIETRAAEQDRLRVLLAGMSELESSIENCSSVPGDVKRLLESMFAEVVELAPMDAASVGVSNCVTPPGMIAEQSVPLMHRSRTSADEDEEQLLEPVEEVETLSGT